MVTHAAVDSADKIEMRVRRIIANCQRLPIDSVTSDKTFTDLGVDSLSSISIAFDLEDEFNLEIPDKALDSIRSVQGAINGIRQLLQKESSG